MMFSSNKDCCNFHWCCLHACSSLIILRRSINFFPFHISLDLDFSRRTLNIYIYIYIYIVNIRHCLCSRSQYLLAFHHAFNNFKNILIIICFTSIPFPSIVNPNTSNFSFAPYMLCSFFKYRTFSEFL